MVYEIERKFFLGSLPTDIDSASKTTDERYFLEITPESEIRIQRKADKIYREQKITDSKLSSNKDTTPITVEEFNRLKKKSIGRIERDSYRLPGMQNATIKVYHGRFEGLIRAEVEFSNTPDAIHFSPPDWFGPELTYSDLGRDSRLLNLSDSEFSELLAKLSRATS